MSVPVADVARYHTAALAMADEARRIVRPALERGGFRIENPNAVQSCACGSSFRTAAGEQGTPCSH